MAGKVNNKYLSGNNGEVWLDGEELGDLTEIDSKITFNIEEIKLCGKQGTDYCPTGWSGEGSLKFQKTQSRGVKLLSDAVETGVIPEVTIISCLKDKHTGKAERCSLTVIFTEFSPIKFANQSLIEEEMPFKILDYKPIETI